MTPRDRARVTDLARELAAVHEGEGATLCDRLPELTSLLRAETACSYATMPAEQRLSVDFAYTWGVDPSATDAIRRWFEASQPGWGHYNPMLPDPKQRNVALTLAELERLTGQPIGSLPIMDLGKKIRLWRDDQLRVLLCDGPALIAWVGVFRDEAFGLRERRLLASLIDPLRSRARLERLLGHTALKLAAIDAAMEAIGAAALLATSRGAIVYANSAGRCLLEQDGAGTLAGVREAVAGRSDRFRTTRIAAPAAPDHYLVVARASPGDVATRLPLVAARWGITPRQVEVLALLARGVPNKTIASTLACALGTVELHVSALLEKTGAGSRAELVARFWTTAF